MAPPKPPKPSKGTKARFQTPNLRSIVSNILSHLSPPTHPSTTSESALGSSYHNHESTGGSYSHTPAPGSHPLEILNARDGSSKRRRKGGPFRKGSQANSNSRFGGDDEDCGPQEPVSHVVVDHDFTLFKPRPAKSGSDSGSTPMPSASGVGTPRTAGSEAGDFGSAIAEGFGKRRSSGLEKSKGKDKGKAKGKSRFARRGSAKEGEKTKEKEKRNRNMSDEDDDVFDITPVSGEEDDEEEGGRTRVAVEKRTQPSGSSAPRRDMKKTWIETTVVYEFLVERLWPNMVHFMDSKYSEGDKEYSYQKEAWFSSKMGALASSFFFVVNYILTLALLPRPYSIWNWYAYFGIAGFLTLPLPIMVMWDFPRLKNWIWQPWLLGATWVFPIILIIEMFLCGFFAENNQCGTRNFINLLGFAFGMPTLAAVVMRQARALHAVGASAWIILIGVLLLGQPEVPNLFYRNVINFAMYHSFLIGVSFFRERSDRAMFALRQQLKIQYRAVQSAQVMERKASDSKKRFVSYIFHEVRVPLNTALLAVQNLDGEKVFEGIQEDQKQMVDGLMGSLAMMEKVLNDVLSFNRMESGRFTQARKTFSFHRSIQLVALSHRSQADMAGIDLSVELDPHVEKIGGIFIGDEMRLRQVTSNLVSNALKFTDSGSVRIVTKLLFPRLEPTPSTEIDDPLRQAEINAERQKTLASAQIAHHRLLGDGRRSMSPDVEKGSVHVESIRQSRESRRSTTPAPATDTANTTPGPDPTVSISDPSSTPTAVNVASGSAAPAAPTPDDKAWHKVHKAIIRVEVHDTGVGLKKQDVIDNRLFSPYVQTEIGRRQGGKGSGLGLALVRQIVKLSGGRLGVDSEFGKGSTFWFELPYSLPSPSKAESEGITLRTPTIPRTHAFSADHMSEAGVVAATGGGGGGYTLSAPVSTVVVRDSDLGLPGTRPVIGKTDSTRPLLGHRVTILPETTIMSTFSPPDSSPEDEMRWADPFVTPATERRSSEWTAIGSSGSEPSNTGSVAGMGAAGGAVADAAVAGQMRSITSPTPEGAVTAEAAMEAFDGTVRDAGGAGESADAVGGTSLVKVQAAPAAATISVEDENAPLFALIVDDDPLTRMLMSRMMKRLGHQVTTAENGKIALDLIRESYQGSPNVPSFDVCFLDNQMPLLSGVEVAREVRLMGCPLYIVGCTGNALREDQDEYIGAGADEIIPKPIHQKLVVEMIKNARKRVKGETQPNWDVNF